MLIKKPNKNSNIKPVDFKVIAINSLIFLMIAYFAFHSLSGSRGLIAYYKLKKELATEEKLLSELTREKKSLEQRVRMLHPNKMDADYVDELARHELGMIAPDEVMVNLNKTPPK